MAKTSRDVSVSLASLRSTELMETLTPAEPATGVLNTFLAGVARLSRQPGRGRLRRRLWPAATAVP